MPLKKFILAFITIFSLVSCSKKEEVAPQPNVLLIVFDDLNDWVLEKFPNTIAPNLKKLADESFNFKNAYANAPLCIPSRTSFMTGKLPSNIGIYLFPEYPFSSTAIIKKKLLTLPENFRDSGYETLATGKIFHVIKSQDHFYEEHHRETARDDFPGLIRSKVIYRPHDESFILSDADKAIWAIKKIDQGHEKPFFLSLGFEYPHLPWIVPKKYFDLYPLETISLDHIDASDLDDLPQETLVFNDKEINRYYKYEDKMKEIIQGYLASLTYVDEQLGRVLDALENSPYKDNTIVVVFSDHGYHLGEKTMLCKKTLWERSNHIPFLIKIPGHEAKEIEENVSLIDLFPTLNELCKLNEVPGLDGESFTKLLFEGDPNWKNSAISTIGKDRHSIKKDHWRYIRYSDGSEELYDHRVDLEEYDNLAQKTEYQETKAELSKLLPQFNITHINFNINEMVWIKTEANDGFWIDEHEVTNKEFLENEIDVEDKGSMVFDHDDGKWTTDRFASWKRPQGLNSNLISIMNHPVTHISYEVAQQYCHSLNKRLPSKEEWEIAAGELKIKSGDSWLANIFQGEFPENNTLEDGFQGTAPVKSFEPNSNGLFDMAGNVWEWVEPDVDQYIIKGGSFLCGDHCKGFNPINDFKVEQDHLSSHIGFRCAQ